LVAHDVAGEYGQTLNTGDWKNTTGTGDATAAGAGMGAVLGGLAGMLVGLGALIIPGIGPVLAAGPLATVLSGIIGAGVGAVGGGIAGGLIGALVDMGVPEDQAQYYAEGVRRGGVLVTARVPDDQESQVRNVLNRHNAVDVERRANDWRTRGWTGYDPTAQPYTREQVAEERRTYGYGTSGMSGGMSSGMSSGTMSSGMSNTFTDNEAYYRRHYAGTYGATGRDYDAYRPAYEYGQSLRSDPRYRDWDWERVEPEARRDWETRYPNNAWADFKAAVRTAWENVKATVR
jgi:hypothetical protein